MIKIEIKINKPSQIASCQSVMSAYKAQRSAAHGDIYPTTLDIEVMSQRNDNFLNGLKFLELGAGVGCVGLTAATLGAEVILTDLPDTLPLLKFNITENKGVLVSQGGFAISESLSWGDIDSDIIKDMTFDYIVMADCVYYEESLEPLIETLLHINQSIPAKPRLLIAQELRESDIQKRLWKIFYEKLHHFFNIIEVPQHEQHPQYYSKDILVLECTRKEVR